MQAILICDYHRLAARLGRRDDAAASLPPTEVLPRHAQVVLIGDFLSPLAKIEALVKHYVGSGVKGHLLQTIDPTEESLPFTGRTRFAGLEGEGEILIGRPEAVRADYVARFTAHRDSLAHLARTAAWSFAVHHTDRPAQTALLALYGAMAAPTAR